MGLSLVSGWAVRGILALGVLLTQLDAAWAKGEIVDIIERSCPVSGRVRLIVNGREGRTTIVAGNASQVHVKAMKEVRGASGTIEAQQYASRVQILIEQKGDRIEVTANYPKSSRKSSDLPRVLVHFEVETPRACDVTAKVTDGLLKVEGIEGSVDLSANEADLMARSCSGRIRASTKEGSLSLEDVRGEVAAHTQTGSLRVSGVLEALESQSSDGRVEIRALPGSVMKSGWDIRTGNGNVHLYLPDSFAAEVDATTGEGVIVTDHSLTIEGELSKRRLTGRMNGGTWPLRIHTSEGDIHILR